MLFNNKKLNLILNKLLANNKFARANVVNFFKSLPEELLTAIFDCCNTQLIGKNYYVNTLFEPSTIQLDVVYNDSLIRIDYYLIPKDKVDDVPLDNHNDIFFPELNQNIISPAYFNIVYNANLQEIGAAVDYDFYIVKKQQENGEFAYYLVSQSSVDAGIYCSKVDLEDFVAEEDATASEECVVDDENFVEDEYDNFHPRSPRRSNHPRCDY